MPSRISSSELAPDGSSADLDYARLRPLQYTSIVCGHILFLLDRIGRRTWASSLAIAAFVVGMQVTTAFYRPLPHPTIHDEFSYLLEADTLAHGRLANRPHPLWEHFEGVHVLVQPSYMGKYPLGLPIFMAAGQIVVGHPFWGVVLAVALAAAAAVWALRAWTSPAWSIVGGLMAALAFGTGHYWARSYFGGGVVLLGSMLVIGAYRRLVCWRKLSAAWWLGIGSVLLFLTRPLEGGLLVAAALGGIILNFFWNPQMRSWHVRRTLPILATIFLPFLVFQGIANRAATGSVFRMAYVEHAQQYDRAPVLWILKPDLGPKRGVEVRKPHDGWELSSYYQVANQSLVVKFRKRLSDIRRQIPWSNSADVISAVLVLPQLLAGGTFLLLALALSFVGLFFETWYIPHYGAPLMAAVLVTQIYSLFLIARSKAGTARIGRVAAVLLTLFLFSRPPLLQTTFHFLADKDFKYTGTIYEAYKETGAKENIERKLNSLAGAHVVIVRRSPSRISEYEWVYNSADIDGQKIIWAQDLGAEKNSRLFRYYAGRQFWLCEPEAELAPGWPKLTKLDPRPSPSIASR